jgi:uncharacterized protein
MPMNPGARALRVVLRLPQHALILLVRAYRLLLKPWLGNACRFEPTCSAYTLEALQRHGALGGVALGGWRLLRCHPWCDGGCEPVPATFAPRDTARGLFTRWVTGSRNGVEAGGIAASGIDATDGATAALDQARASVLASARRPATRSAPAALSPRPLNSASSPASVLSCQTRPVARVSRRRRAVRTGSPSPRADRPAPADRPSPPASDSSRVTPSP